MSIKAISSQQDPVLQTITKLKQEIGKVIVGQENLIDRMILGLLCQGHILIEGIPGLAKTLTVNSLAQALGLAFSRIQFTPDLLPSDLTGSLIYDPSSKSFESQKGPIFANLLLADEINRSPAKVQSALLEAMQEKQVTLGKELHRLPSPFLVLATQNPVEQEGTYPLPEAQVDRFLFKVQVAYPSFDEELEVIRRQATKTEQASIKTVVSQTQLNELTLKVNEIFISPALEKYIIHLVTATRTPSEYGMNISHLIRFGASPRASINLAKASKARALTQGRDYVLPEDVRNLAPDIFRHRIALSYQAEIDNVCADGLIEQILQHVPVPQD